MTRIFLSLLVVAICVPSWFHEMELTASPWMPLRVTLACMPASTSHSLIALSIALVTSTLAASGCHASDTMRFSCGDDTECVGARPWKQSG